MRVKQTNGELTVSAIAGTHVVLLAMNMPEEKCDGLLGFAIQRTDLDADEKYWLEGMKVFPSVKLDFPPGSQVSTRKHPIQGFTWSDLSVKPGNRYIYRVVALDGEPGDPQERVSVEVKLTTEAEQLDDGHEVYFNRGTGASQEYARRFNNKRPDEVGEQAFVWLSRGLHESLIGFIQRAKDKDWGLRVAAYEFTEPSVLKALRDAAKMRKADVQIVYHAREGVDTTINSKGKEETTPTGANRTAVHSVPGLADLCTERAVIPKGDISHNKFIVLLHKGKPVATATGSTNFSKGGIFGHSNVVHIVNDKDIAQQYLGYWEELQKDPHKKVLGPILEKMCAVPTAPLAAKIPAKGTTTVFSPRTKTDALDYYVALGGRAKKGLFMTFAFGMNAAFQDLYRTSKAGLRMTVMEKAVLPNANSHEEEEKIIALRKMVGNRFAIGGVMPTNVLEHWVDEKLTGFNVNVKYLHTKYSLIDPLSDDPIVVSGSANFSKASCIANDENMLVIRGDTRVADIYLGEFMRLYKHYAFRDWLTNAVKRGEITLGEPLPVEFLDEENHWWRQWFGHTDWSAEREYFTL